MKLWCKISTPSNMRPCSLVHLNLSCSIDRLHPLVNKLLKMHHNTFLYRKHTDLQAKVIFIWFFLFTRPWSNLMSFLNSYLIIVHIMLFIYNLNCQLYSFYYNTAWPCHKFIIFYSVTWFLLLTHAKTNNGFELKSQWPLYKNVRFLFQESSLNGVLENWPMRFFFVWRLIKTVGLWLESSNTC